MATRPTGTVGWACTLALLTLGAFVVLLFLPDGRSRVAASE